MPRLTRAPRMPPVARQGDGGGQDAADNPAADSAFYRAARVLRRRGIGDRPADDWRGGVADGVAQLVFAEPRALQFIDGLLGVVPLVENADEKRGMRGECHASSLVGPANEPSAATKSRRACRVRGRRFCEVRVISRGAKEVPKETLVAPKRSIPLEERRAANEPAWRR